MKKDNRGITLIALIITIIIILILAGISITTLTGDNGIIGKAAEAKISSEKSEEKEMLDQAVVVAMGKNKRGNLKIDTLKDTITSDIKNVTIGEETNFPLTVTYTTTGNKYKVYEDGKVDVKGPSITEYVNVGDYVDYDPTRGVTDTSKLTYTSPTGTGQSHGNGYTSTEEGGGQTFTAKSTAESGINWRVLSVTENKVELISETIVKKNNTNDNSGSFVLKGAIGYLYAEQELNEVCKIYGYGYGTDLGSGGSYEVGGPKDTLVRRKIAGTGARSIIVDDINKLVKLTTEDDFKALDSNYGSIENPTSDVKYPTTSESNGQSTSTGIKNLKYTKYTYYKSKINDTDIRNMIFKNSYWLASRVIYTGSNVVHFDVRNVTNGDVTNNGMGVCVGYSSLLYESTLNGRSVRPIVTLKADVIDIQNATENSRYRC